MSVPLTGAFVGVALGVVGESTGAALGAEGVVTTTGDGDQAGRAPMAQPDRATASPAARTVRIAGFHEFCVVTTLPCSPPQRPPVGYDAPGTLNYGEESEAR